MIIDKEYEHYRVPVAMDGTAGFFSSNAATNWNFINYSNGSYNGLNKLKKYKKIKSNYFDDLQEVYQSDVSEQIKEYILLLKSQDIPTRSIIKANLAKPKKQQHIYNNPVFINGTFYGSETSTSGSNNTSVKRSHEMEENADVIEKKKQNISSETVQDTERGKKEPLEEETEQLSDSLWKKWVLFLRNPTNIGKFHPFSPEYHHIIRRGKGIFWRPNLDSDLYNRHVDLHYEISYPLSNTVADYISFVVDSVVFT
ncbi:hypothetical protein RMCBS344292_09099 [Rhizopus microsporus]|nr:hypothetical protein RMCBS344292_09099 [Rhizopus microsporus]